tara:strand:- start:2280 stop:2516 length:237 start_codon:yes stop_codon:yes gene_type:complete
MAKKKEEPKVNILGKEYSQKNIDDMSPEVKAMLEHRQDLMNKIQRTNFNLIQMQFGLKAFEDGLKENGIGEEQNQEAA